MNDKERKDLEQVKKEERNITESVMNRIDSMVKSGSFDIPEGYSVGNALNAAWVQINITKVNNTPLIKACTIKSIYNSLLYMTVQGLNPIKNQCYFIPYAGELKLFRSYFGTETVAKRVIGKGADISARLVYEGDKLELEIDDKAKMKILSHKTSLENINNGKIIGCYVKIFDGDKLLNTEYMTIKEIKVSWTMNQMKKGQTTATQEKFEGEFCKRTVITRACKPIINTSNDNDVLVNAFKKTTENEYINVTPKTKEFEEKGKGTASLLDRIKENNDDKFEVKGEGEIGTINVPDDSEKEDLLNTNVITPDGEIIEGSQDPEEEEIVF